MESRETFKRNYFPWVADNRGESAWICGPRTIWINGAVDKVYLHEFTFWNFLCGAKYEQFFLHQPRAALETSTSHDSPALKRRRDIKCLVFPFQDLYSVLHLHRNAKYPNYGAPIHMPGLSLPISAYLTTITGWMDWFPACNEVILKIFPGAGSKEFPLFPILRPIIRGSYFEAMRTKTQESLALVSMKSENRWNHLIHRSDPNFFDSHNDFARLSFGYAEMVDSEKNNNDAGDEHENGKDVEDEGSNHEQPVVREDVEEDGSHGNTAIENMNPQGGANEDFRYGPRDANGELSVIATADYDPDVEEVGPDYDLDLNFDSEDGHVIYKPGELGAEIDHDEDDEFVVQGPANEMWQKKKELRRTGYWTEQQGFLRAEDMDSES